MSSSIISILFSSLFFLLNFNLSAISAKSLPSHRGNHQNKCSHALAKVIYTPESCAYKYLNKLRKKFLLGTPLLFTPQIDSFIFNFEIVNRISVTIVDAMGSTTNYNYQTKTKTSGQPVKYLDTARSYINFPGFVRQISSSSFYFTFVVFSDNAEVLSVTFTLPISQDPIVC